MKTWITSFVAAFSTYSKIPMPRFMWDSSDMKYQLCFFPLVGACIGGVEWLWYLLSGYLHIGMPAFLLLAASIPLIVTGGFHLDGFMDTMDALHSYQTRERKLEILKDPHIGAFSVISLMGFFLLYSAFLSEVKGQKAFLIVSMGFVLSRVLAGISILTFQKAKKEGMLQVAAHTAQKKVVLSFLIVELLLTMAAMLYISVGYGIAAILAAGFVLLYYRWMSYRQFGGITGDLAGFFVTVSELFIAMAVSITKYIAG